MNAPAIRVRDLGKQYRVGAPREGRDLRETLVDLAAAPLRRLRRSAEAFADDDSFWALSDVSFDVQPGEVVGVIGRNGAGKSTLLKVLSRITEPTVGRVELVGRVASLLEVGTGFHPELTGRENVFLNGAILGMKRREIVRKFDAIVAFSGIERFLDTPVKRYSSGMYVRLAFSVAAHLESEILIVDEVLAVGDGEFQRKCLGKMGDVSRQGRTVLFVSHAMQAVSTLTQRALVLDGGRVRFDGPTERAIHTYLRGATPQESVYRGEPSPDEPRIVRVELATSEPNNVQRNGQPLEVRVDIDAPRPVRRARVAVQFVNALGVPLVHTLACDPEVDFCREPGRHSLVCRIPNLRLYQGQYTVTVHFAGAPRLPKLQQIDGICPFEVVMHGQPREYPWQPGICAYTEQATWSLRQPVTA